MADFWMTAGLAAFISLGVSGAVTLWGSQRTIHQQSVIEERRRWRDDIRELVPKLVDPEQAQHRKNTRNQILLRLNPAEDIDAMQHIDAFVSDPSIDRSEIVIGHFQRYLKFEWARAKKEAGWWPFRAAKRAHREIERQQHAASTSRIQPKGDS